MAEPTDKDTRGPTNLRIKFRSANLDEFIQRYAVDVSRGGIFIRTREPLSVDTRLKLDFQLLEAQPLFEGEGTVVWIRQPDATRAEVTPGMGVRFDKLNAESQARLERILSEKERLGQSGKAPGLSKSAGGIAVRRPTGAFATMDQAAAKPGMPPPPPPPSAGPPPPPPAARPPTPALGTAPMPSASASAPRFSPFAASAAGRPRATTGAMSAFRSAPVPSAVFEQPTADDIDKALSVLEDKPGPVPAPPPPPRLSPDAPIHVADDASNEPTRVSDLQEFAANEAVTGRAAILPEDGLPDSAIPELQEGAFEETRRSELGDEATIAASPAAFAAAEQVLSAGKSGRVSVDSLLGPNLPAGAPAVPEVSPSVPGGKPKVIVEGPMAPTESGRFRTTATYRRPRKAAKRAVALLVLAAAAGGAYKFRDRLQSLISPPRVTVAPVPSTPTPPTPEPAAAVDAGAAATGAVDASAAPAPAAQAPAAPAVKPTIVEQPAPAKPAKVEEERPVKKKKQRAGATEAATPAVAEKPAAEKPAPEKEKPAAEGEQKPAGEAPAPTLPDTGAAPAAPAAPAASAGPPLLKITSSPAGADVIIDGAPVGTTPFSSKDVDPSASHAITVKKEGFDPQDRAIAAGDWSKGKAGLSLKVNVKLRRAAGAAQPAAEPAKEAKPEVEILTPGD